MILNRKKGYNLTQKIMVNMYSIKKQFFTAVGLFSFFLLCGFMSPLLSSSFPVSSKNKFETKGNVDYSLNMTYPNHNLKNGTIEIVVNVGKPPYKVLVYSTQMSVKEYQIDKTLTISNLEAGEYMIVISDSENAFRSKTISLINN
jgi:hypothetical protein